MRRPGLLNQCSIIEPAVFDIRPAESGLRTYNDLPSSLHPPLSRPSLETCNKGNLQDSSRLAKDDLKLVSRCPAQLVISLFRGLASLVGVLGSWFSSCFHFLDVVATTV